MAFTTHTFTLTGEELDTLVLDLDQRIQDFIRGLAGSGGGVSLRGGSAKGEFLKVHPTQITPIMPITGEVRFVVSRTVDYDSYR